MNPSVDSGTTDGGAGQTNFAVDVDGEADPKTSEFDKRRWNRGHAAVDRERAAQQREADAARRDRAQAVADERTRDRRAAAGDREDAAADRDDQASDRDRSQATADYGTRGRRGAADDREHAAADRDEQASERDVSQAEAERHLLDRDHAAAEAQRITFDRDRSDAEADRRTSNRDHAADDREHAAADRYDDASDRARSQVEADQRIANRGQAAQDRHHAAADRDHTAADRDVYQAAADQRAVNRRAGARDREHAAADRREAIADRAGADRDYGLRRDDLRRAQLDQLTGAFGREIGLLLLEREIDRARHGNGHLVLAYIDVDGLKQANDTQGHHAGDALLSDVAEAIQKHLRSYDTLVRVGGDEFVCALGDCTLAVARGRLEQIRDTMRQSQPTASISVGFSELLADDTLEALTMRADADLYEVKRAR